MATVELPHVHVRKIQNWPDERGEDLEFRLQYHGSLPAAGNNSNRNREKHEIRRCLHQQLREVWDRDRFLSKWTFRRNDQDWQMYTLLAQMFRRCDHHFVPLVSEKYGLACSLDVLFLRRELPGSILKTGGDIDNRLKTLFDALRIPQKCDELPKDWTPTKDESPLFCLLEDDALITEVKVTTDRLLTPVESGNENDVSLVIHVKARIVDYEKAYIEMGL